MRYIRHIEDPDGSLIEVLYYCCRLCFVEEPDPDIATLPGGWWPCLDSELDVAEPCRVCEEPIGGCQDRPTCCEESCGEEAQPCTTLKVGPAPSLLARDR